MNAPTLNVEAIRAQFPVLNQEVNGHPLAYLDNAASAQRPQAVIDALVGYYTQDHANIHRGVHTLSQRATEAYERARIVVQKFLNAERSSEVIFTRGTTEAVNLVCDAFTALRVEAGDEIVITAMEHHANLVPWQQLCARKGAKLVVAPIFDSGELDIETFERLLTPKVKMAAFVHASNALGTLNPVEHMVSLCRERGIPTLLDGAQWIPHGPVDVQALGCDFYVFSGHKVYGPTGIGVLWGKQAHLEVMQPYQLGGDMIETVSFESTTFNAPPAKFEAGTPHIAGAVGLAAALQWFEGVGFEAVAAYESMLLAYATERIGAVEGVRLVGTAPKKVSVVSFVMDGVHPSDLGTLVDQQGVAVRTGHHCTEPLMHRLGVSGTARASFACYNTRAEVDQLVVALEKARRLFL
ncbi:MAG: cysteine desulfurase [Bradymonadia bacterium]